MTRSEINIVNSRSLFSPPHGEISHLRRVISPRHVLHFSSLEHYMKVHLTSLCAYSCLKPSANYSQYNIPYKNISMNIITKIP